MEDSKGTLIGHIVPAIFFLAWGLLSWFAILTRFYRSPNQKFRTAPWYSPLEPLIKFLSIFHAGYELGMAYFIDSPLYLINEEGGRDYHWPIGQVLHGLISLFIVTSSLIDIIETPKLLSYYFRCGRVSVTYGNEVSSPTSFLPPRFGHFVLGLSIGIEGWALYVHKWHNAMEISVREALHENAANFFFLLSFIILLEIYRTESILLASARCFVTFLLSSTFFVQSEMMFIHPVEPNMNGLMAGGTNYLYGGLASFWWMIISAFLLRLIVGRRGGYEVFQEQELTSVKIPSNQTVTES